MKSQIEIILTESLHQSTRLQAAKPIGGILDFLRRPVIYWFRLPTSRAYVVNEVEPIGEGVEI